MVELEGIKMQFDCINENGINTARTISGITQIGKITSKTSNSLGYIT